MMETVESETVRRVQREIFRLSVDVDTDFTGCAIPKEPHTLSVVLSLCKFHDLMAILHGNFLPESEVTRKALPKPSLLVRLY